jgi:hypothetical protein
MNTVVLHTGREIPLEYVALDVASQRFFYGSFEVTDYLDASQKRQFNGYDVERANRAASDAARDATGLPRYADGNAFSWGYVLGDTARGIGEDVATAAQSIRDFAGIGPENAGKRSPLFWTAVIVGVGFVLYQVGAFAWLKKKLTA